jgi:hypothetical protein
VGVQLWAGISPPVSLRGVKRRSNLGFDGKGDCFATVAMTTTTLCMKVRSRGFGLRKRHHHSLSGPLKCWSFAFRRLNVAFP